MLFAITLHSRGLVKSIVDPAVMLIMLVGDTYLQDSGGPGSQLLMLGNWCVPCHKCRLQVLTACPGCEAR